MTALPKELILSLNALIEHRTGKGEVIILEREGVGESWLEVSVMHSLQKEKAQNLIGCQLSEGLVLFHMAKEGGTKTNGLKWKEGKL